MATSDKMNYDANQNTYCQKNFETRAAINDCREKILKLERDLRAASNNSKADAQDSHGNDTIESYTAECYRALKIATFKAFPEIDEGPLPLGVLKDIAETLPECPQKLKDIPLYQESLENNGMDESVNDEYQFDDMILSVCQSFIKTRSLLKLKEQIALHQDHLRVLLQAKDKVDNHKTKIDRLRTDNQFQITQNDALRQQV